VGPEATITGRLLITGAAGAIGSCLREGLRPQVGELVLTDALALEPTDRERFVQANLADRDAVMRVADGVVRQTCVSFS